MGLFGSKSSSSGTSGGSSSGGSFSSGPVDAVSMREAFTRYLDQKDFKYVVIDKEDNIVAMTFGGSRYDTFVLTDFDEGATCDSVHFSSQHFAKCSKDKLPQVIIKLNELNRRFRWVKTWVDEEGQLTADSDALVSVGTVGPECLQIIIRFSNILEDILEALEGYAEPDEETANAVKMAMLIAKMS